MVASLMDLDTSKPSRTDRLRLRHLKLLDQIARRGSLTAASEALGISQPSATKLLQDMETVLRCTLVDRNTRGGVLTSAGQRTLERGRLAIHALHALEEQLTTAPELPLVRLGILRLAGISILPRLVQRLAEQGDLPRLHLHEDSVGGLMDGLASGALDCVITRLEARDDEHWMEPFDLSLLENDPYAIACAPSSPFSGHAAVGLSDLTDQPWIVPPKQTYTRRAFEVAFLGLGLPPPVPRIESPSFQASFAILADNPNFLAMAPESAVRYYEALGIVKTIQLTTPFPEDRMVLAIRREVLAMPAVEAIRTALRGLVPSRAA